jgi:hypothetical protein
MRLEGLGKLKKEFEDLIATRTREFPAFNMQPQVGIVNIQTENFVELMDTVRCKKK